MSGKPAPPKPGGKPGTQPPNPRGKPRPPRDPSLPGQPRPPRTAPERVPTFAELAEAQWQSWPPEVRKHLAEQAARILRPRPVTTPTRRAS